MSVIYTHPDEFETETTPEMTRDGSRIQYNFDALVARNNRSYLFLDYVFATDNLHGAVGTEMVPVHEDEIERRMEQLQDKEWSRLAHIYNEQDRAQSWSDWISGQINREGHRLVVDESYCHKYGATVRERAATEGVMQSSDIEVVECLGGGRMFDQQNDFDEVYDSTLLDVIKTAEEHGLGAL
jgi:hypothetical protein